jgi:hypothetical protein
VAYVTHGNVVASSPPASPAATSLRTPTPLAPCPELALHPSEQEAPPQCSATGPLYTAIYCSLLLSTIATVLPAYVHF